MDLSPEVRKSYTKIIDGILESSDLTTVSAKQIRKGIQAAVGHDIDHQKDAIKILIVERFDVANARLNGQVQPAPPNGPEQAVNGHTTPQSAAEPQRDSTPPSIASPASPTKKRIADGDAHPDGVVSSPKKKPRREADSDAALAARLQAEENLRARPTRGGNTRKAAPIKKKKSPGKTKTSKKVRSDDDSDIDASSEEKKVNRNTGFHKPMTLSTPLSELLGEATLSRPQCTKKIWEYIRAHGLQDPSDRRQIRCDDAMRAVFKTDRIHMFTMTKILNQHLYGPDE